MKSLSIAMFIILSTNVFSSETLACFGTEPFWSIGIANNELTFDNFENVETSKIVKIQNAAGTSDFFATVISTENNATLSIVGGECNDGMSERIYSHHAIYKSGDIVFYGCCDKF